MLKNKLSIDCQVKQCLCKRLSHRQGLQSIRNSETSISQTKSVIFKSKQIYIREDIFMSLNLLFVGLNSQAIKKIKILCKFKFFHHKSFIFGAVLYPYVTIAPPVTTLRCNNTH